MGVMSQLIDQHKQAEKPQPAPIDEPRPSVAPCPACGSRFKWMDVYAGLHCRECDPWPGTSLVKHRFLIVVDAPDGYDLISPAQERQREELEREAETRGDYLEFKLPNGDRVTTMRGRPDHSRVASETGVYDPPLARGPVGDLTLDEWFERLPTP